MNSHYLTIILILILLQLVMSLIKREYKGVCDSDINIIYNDHIIGDTISLNSIITELKLSSSSSIDVDFNSEFIVLTTSHASIINGNCIDNGDGTIVFNTMSTRDYRPNVSYKFFVIDKNNFTSCNNTPL